MADTMPTRMGSEHPNIAPYGDLFQTVNGEWIVLAIGTDKQFVDLIEVLDLSEALSDLKYATNASRVLNRAALNAILALTIGKYNTEKLEALLASMNIPYGRVKNMEEVFAQTSAQNLILDNQIDNNTAKRVRTTIFRID
jgi:crotonobetainyl-CoA:carnitine CoA-transferase CaiB-like acyl-CoA transferase